MTVNENGLDLVILISGRGSNAMAIADAIDEGRLAGSLKVRAVIADCSTEQPAAGVAAAARRGLDTAIVDPKQHADKASFEAALQCVIDSFEAHLVVLAGFMRVLSADFVEHYAGRIINIHPSLLPKYRGLNTHQRALDADDAQHGASVHWVTPELDAGPVLTQASIDILASDNATTLAERLLPVEHRLYPATLALLSNLGVLSGHERNDQTIPDGWLLDRDFDAAGRCLSRRGSGPATSS